MADIREIDMAKATNAEGKKIRLVGDDGKGYWMEFSDLAAVVGGLLPTNGIALTSLAKDLTVDAPIYIEIEYNNIYRDRVQQLLPHINRLPL